jgi:hypothetical protein
MHTVDRDDAHAIQETILDGHFWSHVKMFCKSPSLFIT